MPWCGAPCSCAAAWLPVLLDGLHQSWQAKLPRMIRAGPVCVLLCTNKSGTPRTMCTCHAVQGVEDNGHPRGLDERELDASLGVLRSMAAEVGAQAEVLQVSGRGTDSLLCPLAWPAAQRMR